MQTGQPKFTFTSQLCLATKWIQQKDTIQQQNRHRPIINDVEVEGTVKTLACDLARCFQSRDLLIYAMIAWEGRLLSNLTLYYFGKAKGQNQYRQIPSIKGKVVSMQFIYPQQILQNQTSQYQTKLIMGNQDGFIKIIDFRNKSQIQFFQIDTKAIVDIKVPPPSSFHNHHVFCALLEDFNVYIVSIKMKMVLAHFRPTIMMCDAALSLQMHISMKYMLETTHGGYLVLWKINENLFKKLEILKPEATDMQRLYNVFPTSILHSASIQGIIWASFVGDFIALITKKGVFKIIALNIQQKQQFAVLLEYQIANGHSIKDAKILPKQQCLIVVKSQGYNNSMLQCIFYSPELLVTKIMRIRVRQIPQFNSVLLSKNFRYIFLKNNQSRFFITYTDLIEEKIIQNKKNNDKIREILF